MLEIYGANMHLPLISQFQHDDSSVHETHFVQEWLSLQADIKLTGWPPQAPNMKPIHNVWGQLKRKMQETWPIIPPRTAMTSGSLCLMPGRKMLRLSVTFNHQVRMRSVVEAQEYSTFH
jgi:hypothetical protein